MFCTVLAEIAGIVVDLDRFGRMEKLLKNGFSPELMHVIDTNHDGRVRVRPTPKKPLELEVTALVQQTAPVHV
jgi:hypothetical protein